MRQVRRSRVVTGAVLGALPLLLVTGCSFDFSFGGPGVVSADEVAEKSSQMLAEQAGLTPDDFTCSEDLPAEVGAEIRCELTHEGESLGVTVTVTSVDGDEAEWDVVVDDAPADDTAAEDTTAEEDSGATANGGSVTASDVAEQSSAQLAAAVGQAPESFSCMEDLPAEVGAEIRCNLVDGGMNYGVTITVTAVNGDNVEWDILVDDAPL